MTRSTVSNRSEKFHLHLFKKNSEWKKTKVMNILEQTTEVKKSFLKFGDQFKLPVPCSLSQLNPIFIPIFNFFHSVLFCSSSHITCLHFPESSFNLISSIYKKNFSSKIFSFSSVFSCHNFQTTQTCKEKIKQFHVTQNEMERSYLRDKFESKKEKYIFSVETEMHN